MTFTETAALHDRPLGHRLADRHGLVIDTAWIINVVLPLYETEFGSLSDSLDQVTAVSFYLIYTAGITIYGLVPGKDRSRKERTLRRAMHGFLIYAAYALTLRVITGISWTIVITDIAWGAAVCAATTFLATFVYSYALRRTAV